MEFLTASFAQAKYIILKISGHFRKAELLSDCNRNVAVKNENLRGDKNDIKKAKSD